MRFSVRGLWLVGLLLVGCNRQPVEHVAWETMGTVAAVRTRGTSTDAQTRAAVVEVMYSMLDNFSDVEKSLNAHDPNSELSCFAVLPDAELLEICNPQMRPCYEAAFALRRQSGGVFNPRWHGTNTFDLGAIAKGFAVDLAVAAATPAGVDALIDLGGNLKSVRGAWRVGIAGSEEVLVLTNGMACATSAEYYRGKHIHDGRTGLAVSNDVASVTVVHPTSALLADGLSTTLFVLGREAGEKFLRKHYPEAKAIWIEKERSSSEVEVDSGESSLSRRKEQ